MKVIYAVKLEDGVLTKYVKPISGGKPIKVLQRELKPFTFDTRYFFSLEDAKKYLNDCIREAPLYCSNFDLTYVNNEAINEIQCIIEDLKEKPEITTEFTHDFHISMISVK